MATSETAAARKVPLLDLKAQHATIRDEVLAEVTRVIDAQTFIMGPEVTQLEEVARQYTKTRHAIGCASGSDALFLALLAAGVGQGDEVLTTPYTFFATAGAIHRAGARPVFADIEESTFNLDPAAVEQALSRPHRIKAVIPVHLFGAPAEMDPIAELCRKHNLVCIEDAAQSIGAEYKGRSCGNLGDMACFSFFPSKNLGCYGDGGLVTTNDDGLAEKLRALRVHGSKKKYYHEWVGVNSRLDALQAAVLRVKFKHLDSWTAGRQKNAGLYRKRLGALDLPVRLPSPAASTTRHVYNQFVICGPRRDELKDHLAQRGVGTEVYYPLSMHQQKCFAYLGYKDGDFPRSEKAARESLALPVYAELAEDAVAYVCDAIASFYR